MTPERELKEKLIQYCNYRGLEVRKLHYEGRTGCPDWLIFGNGKHIFIELKGPKGKVSATQKNEFLSLRAKGGFDIYILNNIEHIQSCIDYEFNNE